MGADGKDVPSGTSSDGKPSLLLISALIAAAAPLTVAIHEWIGKSKELQLAEQNKARDFEMAKQEQAFKTQTWFLENAVDPQKTPELRQQVLRFIKGGSGDPNLTSWATQELDRVDEVVELSRKLTAKEQEVVASVKKQAAVAADAPNHKVVAGPKPAGTDDRDTALKNAIAAQKKAEAEALALRQQLAAKGVRPPDDTGIEIQKIWQQQIGIANKLVDRRLPMRRAPDEH